MSGENNLDTLDEILEAALLAAGEPLSLERLDGLFDEHERPPRAALRTALGRLEARHARGALELLETASGYRLRIRPRLSPWVSRLWDERPPRYSRALLETLALIAYRQPVTRGDIEAVRGVAVSGSIMRTLSERGWIRVVGHRDVPGRPAVYATTRAFLDDFGLATLDALPPMHELKTRAAPPDDASPPPPSPLLAQADAPDAAAPSTGDEAWEDNEAQGGRAAQGGRETPESGERPDNDAARQSGAAQEQDATAGRADVEHAGTASEPARLSFADLEARLAERARDRCVDDDAAGAPFTFDETLDDS